MALVANKLKIIITIMTLELNATIARQQKPNKY
jgi:hypothetical protein